MSTPARRLQPDARRRHLVEAAFDVFASKPYEEVKLEDVAQAADVRRGLLYHYFPDGKHELFAAVFREALMRAVQAMDVDPGTALERKVPRNIGLFIDLALRQDPIYLIFREGRRVNHAGFAPVVAQARRAIALNMALNHLGTPEPSPLLLLALDAYVTFAETLIDEWVVSDGPVPRAQLESLLAGLLGDLVARASQENG